MDFLPKQGVCGTLYLYRHPVGRWHIVTWDGRKYNCNSTAASLEALKLRADNLLWAKDWPRVECKAPSRKMDPCVRVEFVFKSGRKQTLTGEAAEAWLKNVDDIVAAGELRYGQTQMNDHPWEFGHIEG